MKDCKHEFKNKLISHGIPWKCNFYIDICEKCRKTKREIFLAEKLEESRKENTELLKKVEWLQVREAELVQELWEELNQLYGECLDCANSTTTTKLGEISVCKCEKTHRIDKIRKALQGGSEYAEYVRKLEAVAKAAEEAVHHDYITPELHEALADWRSNE